jgi:hypothetical protein
MVSISRQAADDHFGWLAGVCAIDVPASSTLTREQMGWQPAQPGLIADLDHGHHFQTTLA